jgi:hypothetical protein
MLHVKYCKVRFSVGKVSKAQEKEKYTVNFVNFVNLKLPGRLPAVCICTCQHCKFFLLLQLGAWQVT